MNRINLLLAIVGLVPAICGCSTRYDFGVVNTTETPVRDVTIEYLMESGKPYRHVHGFIPPGGKSRRNLEPRPIPESVTLTWQTADGSTHREQVPVSSRVPDPRSFEGTVWFKITGTSVRVTANTHEEQTERAIQQKSIVPD